MLLPSAFFSLLKFIFGILLDLLHCRQNLKCIHTHQRDKSQHIGFKIVFGGRNGQKTQAKGKKYPARLPYANNKTRQNFTILKDSPETFTFRISYEFGGRAACSGKRGFRRSECESPFVFNIYTEHYSMLYVNVSICVL